MKKYQYIYGPVPSRRLGRSLGIDLIPRKICTYNCIYCQIGKSAEVTLSRKEYIPAKDILEEVRSFLKEETASIDYLSLSGSGEPTLHSKIRSIIEELKTLTSIPVAVITNGSLLFEEEVRKDLLRADVVLPSLDAASSEVFIKINRPGSGFSIERVIEGMADFRKVYTGQIWLEILFCKGINDSREELARIKKAVDRIQPDRIHLNTVVRPPTEKNALPLTEEEMEKIRDFFGEKASVISEFDRHPSDVLKKDVGEAIVRVLQRRPLSQSDLSKGMGIPEKELEQYIRPLIEVGKIKTRNFGGSVYYEVSENMNAQQN